MHKFLIIGLGNPGAEYAHTRHNIGYDVLDAFVSEHDSTFLQDRLADRAVCKVKGRQFICIKPTTYMNLSGRAFKYWLDKEKVDIARTLTIMDDLALPLERLRLRKGGSDAGHNGLRDIQLILGTPEYPKLRFGIGNQFPRGRQIDYVLGHWRPDEVPLVKLKIDKCLEIILNFAIIGIEKTMNEINSLKFNYPKDK